MITLPAVLERVATRKDGTLGLSFGTNELSPSTMTDLFSHYGKFCYIAIKPEEFRPLEIENLSRLKADYDDKRKSHSVRLRSVLFRKFEQDNEGFGTFSAYYEHKMESLIEHFKSKLDG